MSPTLSAGFVALSLKGKFWEKQSLMLNSEFLRFHSMAFVTGLFHFWTVVLNALGYSPYLPFLQVYLSSFPITLESQPSQLNLIIFRNVSPSSPSLSLYSHSLFLHLLDTNLVCFPELFQVPLFLLWCAAQAGMDHSFTCRLHNTTVMKTG